MLLNSECRNATSKYLKIMLFYYIGRSGILAIKCSPVRYDANGGTPYSAIFQYNSIQIFKSYPGALYSAIERIAD
jgi:hypothetical protein